MRHIRILFGIAFCLFIATVNGVKGQDFPKDVVLPNYGFSTQTPDNELKWHLSGGTGKHVPLKVDNAGTSLDKVDTNAIGQSILLNEVFDYAPKDFKSKTLDDIKSAGALEITGSGNPEAGSFWMSESVPFEAGKTYRFTTLAAVNKNGIGSAPCGPSFASRDYSVPEVGNLEKAVPDPAATEKDSFIYVPTAWSRLTHTFRVPDNINEAQVRLGQWASDRTFQFTCARITSVTPIYYGLKSSRPSDIPGLTAEEQKLQGNFLKLGNGESIRQDDKLVLGSNTVYKFRTDYNHEGSNDSRVLESTTSAFNSNRWTFAGNQEVVYKFSLKPFQVSCDPQAKNDPPAIKFLDGKCTANVNYYIGGKCTISASTNGKDWTELPNGSIEKTGQLNCTLPHDLFASPVESVYIKIQSNSDASFQVDNFEFESRINSDDYIGKGQTVYATVGRVQNLMTRSPSDRDDQKNEKINVVPQFFNGASFYFLYTNATDSSYSPTIGISSTGKEGSKCNIELLTESSKEGDVVPPFSQRYYIVTFNSLKLKNKFGLLFTKYSIYLDLETPEYYRTDYGYKLPGTNENSAEKSGQFVWWAEPDWKIPQTASRDTTLEEKPIKIFAAKNDTESFQLVFNDSVSSDNEKTAPDFIVTSSELTGPNGAVIPKENIELRIPYYHYVENPTDKTGVQDYWADALVPFDKPVSMSANKNQLVWVTVRVPEEAKPGVYTGKLNTPFKQPINYELHVWDFAIPKKNTVETAWGLGWNRVFQYHNCKTEQEQRAVIDLYLDNFDKHRISPYILTPLDPIQVKWNATATPPCAELDFTAFDKEMERVLAKYNFTNFVIQPQGMGGGTFHDRVEPQIAGFTKDTPEFKAMFKSYVSQLEKHLEEKGWLDMAYVYWFDEPDPKDYEFVAQGFGRLNKYAPKLRRMITEQPSDEFIAELKKADTNINIWCPVSFDYDATECGKRLADDEKLWWYVCCAPKEPYCTLFSDHPGTELRVWFWQAFQRNITGALVWESVWWTSDTAFPDSAQNPYLDPMSYVSGYSVPIGTKQFWGNGDGRFVYPPLDAAVPGMNDGKAVLASPNSSIRWEMLREGIEDYEMLVLFENVLKQREAKGVSTETPRKALREMINEVSSNMTKFTTDPRVIRKVRTFVAEEIEKGW
ncbi:MAG: glycoside hydrolase domain-containing protein [Thermoguttaceae bacterium]